MWVVYQFLVSVVLLRSFNQYCLLSYFWVNRECFRILIVMLTITYRKVYDTLDTQWK